MNWHLLRLLTLGALAATLLGPALVAAQQYPARVVRIVVPGPPGGNSDALARLVANKLSAAWKRQVIVDNRPGASGMIGTELVAKAAPDGYTFMIGHNGTHAINANLRQKLTYDPVADFIPISLAARFPNVIIVHPSLPARSTKELIALARAQPGQLSYGTSGVGFPQHLAGEVFAMSAGIKWSHIPYKGTAAALVDTLAGNISVMISNLPIALPQITAGKVRPIAVTSLTRSAAAPNIPSVSEAALPGYEVITWYGFFAPAGVQEDIVREIHAQITGALRESDVTALLKSQGGDIVASTGKEATVFVKGELGKWAKIVRTTGARAD